MNKTYTYQSRGPIWGLVLILLGLAILGDNLRWFSFDVWEIFWPAIIIVIGIQLLVRRRRQVVIREEFTVSSGSADQPSAPPPGASVPPRFSSAAGPSGDVINESHIMGEVDLMVDNPAFRGGSVSTVFGEVRLDCTRAVPADGEHTLAVNTVFGEVHVYLPAGMEYTVEATTVFGEVDAGGVRRGGVFSNVSFTTQNYATAPRKLRIIASTVFGEVRVMIR